MSTLVFLGPTLPLDQARELLEEVIAEGSGALADQARQLLGRLSG